MFFTDTHVIVYARPMPRYNPHFVVNLSIDLRWPSPLRLRVICPTLHCSRDRQPPPNSFDLPDNLDPLSLHCPGMFAPSTNIVSFLSYQSLARNQPMDMRKRVVLFLHNHTIRPGEFRKEFHWESVRCLKNLLWINNMPVLVKSKTPWYMKTLITWFWLFVVFKKYTIGYCCKTVPLLLGEGNLWLSTRTSDNRSAAEKKSNTKFKRCLIVEYCGIMIDNKI